MENNQSKLYDLLIQKFNLLIIRTKSLMFLETENDIALGYIKTLINFSELLEKSISKVLLCSALYYFQAEFDNSKINEYYLNVDWKNFNNTYCNEHLYIMYNILEFENKFNILNLKDLYMINDILNTYDSFPTNNEDKLIFSYYKAVSNSLIKNYSLCKEITFNMIIDLGDNNLSKVNFIDYLKMRNSLLYLKIIETEANVKELMIYLEGLFETYDVSLNDAFILRIGLKLSDMLYLNNNYEKLVIILEKLLKILKKNKFLGKIYKIKNLASLELCLFSKLSFIYIIMGKSENATRFIKKIEKLINNSNYDIIEDNLLKIYQYYLEIYKIINNLYVDNSIFLKFSHKYVEKYNIDEICLVNYFIKNPNENNVLDKLSNLIYKLFKPNEDNNNLLVILLLVYNYICIINNQLFRNNFNIDDINIISSHSKNIIIYVHKNIDSMNILNINYLKESFIKIYYSYTLTYYYKKEFKKAIDIIDDLEQLKFKLGLNEEPMLRIYSNIIKLKGDLYFKISEFNNSIILYDEVLRVYEKFNIRSNKRALLLFDLGLSYLIINDRINSKKYLELSFKNYETINTLSNEFSEKLIYIDKLLKHKIYD